MEIDCKQPDLWSRPYPPVDRRGPVHQHDRPFLDYGHQDARTIARENKFVLPSRQEQASMDATMGTPIKTLSRALAISCWSKASKHTVLAGIKEVLHSRKLQYICVANEIDPDECVPRLHVQIILDKTASLCCPFLLKYTDCGCQYQVTQKDRAWNEYIKKGLDFVEYGLFESTSARSYPMWPQGSIKRKAHVLDDSDIIHAFLAKFPKSMREVAGEAFELNRTSRNLAIRHLVKRAPAQCLSNLKRFVSHFEFATERISRVERRREASAKKFNWPTSFPNCTPKLKKAMDEWIETNFTKAEQLKCLVLIGATVSGKTTFALSLPGVANHCRGLWNLDTWDDEADYMVMDDVPWDDFKKDGYPPKEDLLTGQKEIWAGGKCCKKRIINANMPAIVLMTPDDAGSLLHKRPRGVTEDEVRYWREHALIYVMGDDEYFYKRPPADLSDGDDSSDDQHGTEFQQKWLQARVESCESVDDQDELPAVNPEMSLAS